MAKFKDEKDREWEIRIDAPAIMQVREGCDPLFLLDKPNAESTYDRLRDDPVTLCRVIYVLCEKQRKERGVDDESFYEGVIGKAIDSATEAMLAAIVNFSPRWQREVLETAAGVRERIQQKGLAAVLEKITDPALEQAVLDKMNRTIDEAIADLFSTPSSSATSSPDSSESTPQA